MVKSRGNPYGDIDPILCNLQRCLVGGIDRAFGIEIFVFFYVMKILKIFFPFFFEIEAIIFILGCVERQNL